MTANEKELIRIIRESENREQAMLTAVEVILSVLMRHGSSEEQVSVVLQEQA
jgi:hypothetical protein